ncbi:MAG: PEP-CTERM system TPR-repeat protein PrsT [Gammaproteobacteria bacterium]|nr:PEP-CTERM system TPR-repeat protein PrsT [Gammaproteobacteria bacterium]
MHLLQLVSIICLMLQPLVANADTVVNKPSQSVNELKNLLLEDPSHLEARLQLGAIYLETGDLVSAEKELLLAQRLGAPLEAVAERLLGIYITQGKYDKITKYLNQHKTEIPEIQATFYAYEGFVKLSQKKNDEARQLFVKAGELEKNNIRAVLGMATYHVVNSDHDAAIKLLSQYLNHDVKNLQVLLFRAGLLRQTGKLDAAEKDYVSILKVKPDHNQANLAMALLNVSRRKPEAVLAALNNFPERLQKSPIVEYLRGLSWYLKNDLDRAEKHLQKVLINVPDHPQTHLLSGVIYYHRQNWQLAEDHLSRVYRVFRYNPSIVKLLSATYLKLRKPNKAEKLLSQLLAASEHPDAQVYSLLGAVYLQTKNNNKAQAMFTRAVEIAPEQPDFKVQLAFGLLAEGDTNKAISELESAVNLGEEKIQADTLLMLSYLKAGKSAKAIAVGKDMQAKYSNSPLPYNLTGLAYMSAGKYQLADEAFFSALRKDSKFEMAAVNRAKNALLSGEQNKAEKLFNDVLRINSNNITALLTLAELAAKKGHSDQRINYLKKVRELQPANTIAITNLAEFYLRKNQPLQALSMLADIPEKLAAAPVVLRLKGIAQFDAGRNAKAISTFEQLVAVAPQNLQANFMLGRAYLRANRLAEARRHFITASKGDAQYQQPMLWIALGEVILKENKHSHVLEITESLLQAGHKLVVIYDLRALAFQGNGQNNDALVFFEKAYTQQPTRQRLIRLASFYKALGNVNKADKLLREWVANHPEDVDTQIMLAVSLQQNGQNRKAIEVYEKALKVRSDNAVVMNNLAWLYHESGDGRAFNLAKKAYEKARNRPEIIDTYGWLLFESGKHARALAILQEALLLSPSHPEIAYHVAVALLKLDRREEARNTLKRIITNSPDSPYAIKAGKLLVQ